MQSMIQMTTMCLSASFCFLVCISPSIVLLIGKPYWNKPPTRHSYKVVYCNYAFRLEFGSVRVV